jgi:glycosyltransferase involved in cell wall biosynthesis
MTGVADVTVTIATLDRPDALARCLAALLSGHRLPTEIVIVDQGQKGPAQAVVEQHRLKQVAIHYLHQARRGLSLSRNTALQCATCPIVAVTDDDCVPDPTWIANLERAFASPTKPDAVTGRVLPLGPEAPGLYMIAPREDTVRSEYRRRALPWVVGSGNNYAVKRDWYVRLRGCDERLGVGSPGQSAEDMDLFYRLLRQGACICYDPEVVVYHELQNERRRLATRWSYAYGMGAFCSLWLRQGDAYALYVLVRWLLAHTRKLATALVAREWWQVRQRSLSLRGTMGGLMYGLRVPSSGSLTSEMGL